MTGDSTVAGNERLRVHEDYEFSCREWPTTAKSHITKWNEHATLCGRHLSAENCYSCNQAERRKYVCKICWKAYETKVKPALDLRSALE